MMFSLFFMNWVISLTFMFLNHPLSLGCILLIQTIFSTMLVGLMFKTFWFSYILFLIMIGGMMIMFIYMTSIASNEKFKMPKMMIYFYLIMMIFLISIFLMDNFYLNLPMKNFMFMNLMNISLNKFFNFPNMKITLIMIFYLLISLIAIVKIVGKTSGPLRQK